MSPQLIDPDWLRGVQGAHHNAHARPCGVTLNRIRFHFLAPVMDCPADATAMEAWLERNILCATSAGFGDAARAIPRRPEPAAGN
jgi:hypothetical protein